MNLKTERLLIRDFARGDAEDLYRIVREKNILRYMGDWAAHEDMGDYLDWIDWCQQQRDSLDVRENKRYAVTLQGTSELIGMVGMGMEETLNEVEVAYFMAEAHQRRGYTKEALNALAEWIFQVSDLPYLMATVDCANEASCKTALACGFELFERRTPIGHVQPNMESDSYFYFRRYRK